MFYNLKEYIECINWYYFTPINYIDFDFWGFVYFKDLESGVNV